MTLSASTIAPSARPAARAQDLPLAGTRLTSIDAYRGFVMLLMASDGLYLASIARHFPGSSVWQFLAYQTDHVAWRGCGLWDLIQPSFMFLVGVALPFSLASRKAKGQSFGHMLLHALWRSLLLIALGIFLRSTHSRQTRFTFEDVLTQIGLGYTFLFLLAWTRPRTQAIAAAAILFGYWLAFALYPAPGPDFNYASVGVPANWPHLHGFAAHWDKNTNLAHWADVHFLNLFPPNGWFKYNSGGYLTLNFVPSLATMIFGLLCGQLLRSDRTKLDKVKVLCVAGIAGLILGQILDLTGICPSVKRIWTPSWTILSTGWTCLMLAGFYGIIDGLQYRRWAFPLVIVGLNSIATYMLAHLIGGFLIDSAKIHFGQRIFEKLGAVYAPALQMAWVLLILWLTCLWMYRRKIFLKI